MKSPVIITGATGSMGAVAVKAMASEGWQVIMACRNLKKGEEVRTKIITELFNEGIVVKNEDIVLMRLDLDSRAGVLSFVEALAGKDGLLAGRKISALFNNAGVISRGYSLTVDGVEQTMAVNYLNTVLLTRSLIPYMMEGGHIVNMVSLTTKFAKLPLDWQSLGEKDFAQLKTYGMSKLALLYFSIALARRYPQFNVNVSDPGVVNSNMISMGRWFDPLADVFFRPFINSPEKGAGPALRALHCHGSLNYYVGKTVKLIPERFTASPLVGQLWDQASSILNIE